MILSNEKMQKRFCQPRLSPETPLVRGYKRLIAFATVLSVSIAICCSPANSQQHTNLETRKNGHTKNVKIPGNGFDDSDTAAPLPPLKQNGSNPQKVEVTREEVKTEFKHSVNNVITSLYTLEVILDVYDDIGEETKLGLKTLLRHIDGGLVSVKENSEALFNDSGPVSRGIVRGKNHVLRQQFEEIFRNILVDLENSDKQKRIETIMRIRSFRHSLDTYKKDLLNLYDEQSNRYKLWNSFLGFLCGITISFFSGFVTGLIWKREEL